MEPQLVCRTASAAMVVTLLLHRAHAGWGFRQVFQLAGVAEGVARTAVQLGPPDAALIGLAGLGDTSAAGQFFCVVSCAYIVILHINESGARRNGRAALL